MSKGNESSKESKLLGNFNLFGPTLPLKDGIDLKEIVKEGVLGSEFEFMTNDLEEQFNELDLAEDKQYFGEMDKFSFMFGNDSDEDTNEKDSELSWFDRQILKMNNLTADGGVRKMIKKGGVGNVVFPNASVTIHYNGYLEDLDEPYDSSRLRNKEMKLTLGRAEVIPGLDIGISSMRKNEIARFLIQPSYAYGEMGCPPRIPANAAILFEVELLSFADAALLDGYEELSEQQKRSLPLERVLGIAKLHNLEGNNFFQKQQYSQAIKRYMRAINTLECANLVNAEEERQVIHICIKSYLNMALSNMKWGKFGKAIASGKKVLQWEVEHPKALYVCGKSLRHLGNFSSSRAYLLRAHSAAPRSNDVTKELQTLDEVEGKCLAVERDMCQKMFSRK